MAQVARNLTDDVNGFLKGKRYLIHDRDLLYTLLGADDPVRRKISAESHC